METFGAIANATAASPRRQWKSWELQRDLYLTPEQISEKLLPAARELPDERAWFTMYLAANTGGRVSELISLRVSDVHPKEPRITLMTLKRAGHPLRTITIPDTVMAVIRDWIKRRELQPDDWLIPAHMKGKHVSRSRVAYWFTLAAAAAGLKTWRQGSRKGNGIHSLRHGHALLWMSRLGKMPGKSPLDMILQIGARLGHSSLRSTLTYLHPSQDAEAVAAVGEIG